MSHFADEFATLVARKLVSEFSFLPPKIMLSSQKLTLEFTLHRRRPSVIITLSPPNGSNIQLGTLVVNPPVRLIMIFFLIRRPK